MVQSHLTAASPKRIPNFATMGRECGCLLTTVHFRFARYPGARTIRFPLSEPVRNWQVRREHRYAELRRLAAAFLTREFLSHLCGARVSGRERVTARHNIHLGFAPPGSYPWPIS